MSGAYVPEAGDIVWINFDPQAGREEAGHRPALVLSPSRYNQLTSLMVCCPMTSRIKGFPWEVLEADMPPSVILADQVKSVDWRERTVRKKGAVSRQALADVRAKVSALLGLH